MLQLNRFDCLLLTSKFHVYLMGLKISTWLKLEVVNTVIWLFYAVFFFCLKTKLLVPQIWRLVLCLEFCAFECLDVSSNLLNMMLVHKFLFKKMLMSWKMLSITSKSLQRSERIVTGAHETPSRDSLQLHSHAISFLFLRLMDKN